MIVLYEFAGGDGKRSRRGGQQGGRRAVLTEEQCWHENR